jgi:hypothetical protein
MTITHSASFENVATNPCFAVQILQDFVALILSPLLKDNRNTILSPTLGESTSIALSPSHKQFFVVVAPPIQKM